MSYSLYKVMHLFGIAMLLVSLGGLALHAANGGQRQANRLRALVAVFHGLGLLLVVVAGFGLLARIGVDHGAVFPGWIWAKLVLWLLFGAASVVPYRKPEMAPAVLVALPLLALTAAYLAIYKPF